MKFDDFIQQPRVRASIRKRFSADSVQCTCPCHDDNNASLTISRAWNDGVLVFDHAGCSTERVLEAWGLTMRDLMPDNDSYNENVPRWVKFIERGAERKGKKLEAYYHYFLVPSGEYAFTRLRYKPKDFAHVR